ncbi:phage gp6-like head-tail connector protein [Kribbella speibonae]|uniref:Phage gp6-like head-tail connector protein n=1 Tax=Kribbella speibonae TaxID=1572660 RepID=A0ABY2ACP0_9ACTN|nr:phage gp6-like head-tail connector protein [Kribbella speibonae]TCC26727.1 phage gp6-like head-tail connector protein [Kribbella speibonae]
MAWAPDYVTATDLKGFLDIPDTTDDAKLAFAITAASRAIDKHCNRQFGLLSAVEDRVYTARWDVALGKYVLDLDDLMTTTGLVITAAAAVTDYTLRPSNADLNGKPWTRLVLNSGGRASLDGVTVTAKFGWTAVPVAIKQAAVLQASRLFKRKDAAFGVAGSPELGSELRLLAKVDPDVAVVLGPYQRRRKVG